MTESRALRSTRRILLGLILFAAFLVRYHLIVQKGFWADEMFDAYFIHESWKTTIERAYDWISPLHMWLVKLAWMLQPSEISMRLPDLAFGLLSIYLFYRFVSRFLRNKWLGLLGALVMALSVFTIHYSIELRPFGSAIAFALLIALSFERAISKRRPVHLIWFLLFAVVGLYNMLSAAFVLAGCGVWLLVELWRRYRAGSLSRADRIVGFSGLGAMAVLAVVILTMNLRQAVTSIGDPPPENLLLSLLGTWQFWLGGLNDRFEPQRILWPMYVATPLFLVGLLYMWRLRTWPMILVTLLTTVYIVISFMSGIHYYSSRFYGAQYPFVLLLVLHGGQVLYRQAVQALGRLRWAARLTPERLAAPVFVAAGVVVVCAYMPSLHQFLIVGKEVARSFREDSQFLDMNAAFNEPIYFSAGVNYPDYYFRIYFHHHKPVGLPRPFREAASRVPFWVYSFEENLFERSPELSDLPYHKVRLRFFHTPGHLAHAYYFYEGQLDEIDWLLSLKPVSARGDIMLRLLDAGRFDDFVRYLDNVELVTNWDLSEMLLKVTQAYLRAVDEKQPTDQYVTLVRSLVAQIDARQPFGDPSWDVGDVYVPARCVGALIDINQPQEALRFGKRYLNYYWQNSNMLWAMARAETRTGNPRKALDYYWETVRRGHVSPNDIWLFQDINEALQANPDIARNYRPMVDAILRLRLNHYRKIADAGNMDDNVADTVLQLLTGQPAFQSEYRNLYERALRYKESHPTPPQPPTLESSP
ncbi:MAG: glycosyltransferase family 39 protein [Candidatus Sumerlaeia bacterium]|nr:glycosyltransferase family 39 protein [Candidatus Sumerlaeia bacterium]